MIYKRVFALLLLLAASHVSDVFGQELSYCIVHGTDESNQFENWIASKKGTQERRATKTYRIPVVVHVLHLGEPVGEGFNYSKERIKLQIRTLNEDFRRKGGTPGFNTHPDGGDAMIEFVLAQIDPAGNPTDGIVRIDMNSLEVPPIHGNIILSCSKYSYWDPDKYLNIWCRAMSLPPGQFLGQATFPQTDLEGIPEYTGDDAPQGVFINALNFGNGETNTDPEYNMGRTLTHEMGHFLGLLHIWGSGGQNACGESSDYCDDTPPVSGPTHGCPSTEILACDGRHAMYENYMDLSADRCMNIFTNDQIERMHIVLGNSPRRKSLVTSEVINRSEEITSTERSMMRAVKVFPNPVTDAFFISGIEVQPDKVVRFTISSPHGQVLLQGELNRPSEMLIDVSGLSRGAMIVTIEVAGFFSRHVVVCK